MSRLIGCMARQQSDQMRCEVCNLVWDVNDPDQPECKTQGQLTMDHLRLSLAPKPDQDKGLLFFQPMPLTYLPGGGMAPGLFRINWPENPNLAYCSMEIPDAGLGGLLQMRLYRFFNARGVPCLVVEVNELDGMREVRYKEHDERGNPGQWQRA